ncbi:MAG: hypothetical protein JXQ73_10285 [Phycisphaerae bacterium]|nr:hypothetical protein [Phycisphaerae bacterium]
MFNRIAWTVVLFCIAVGSGCVVPSILDPNQPAGPAGASLAYLRAVMDEFHGSRFYVYYEADSPHNHFLVFETYQSPGALLGYDAQSTEQVDVGATAMRFDFGYASGSDWGSVCLNNGAWPDSNSVLRVNWGDVPGAGVDLTGGVSMHFRARGAQGGEKVRFFIGGAGRDPNGEEDANYPESTPKRYCTQGQGADPTLVRLTNDWQSFRIDLVDADLSHIIRGFCWEAKAEEDDDGDGVVSFYVDDVYFSLNATATSTRLAQPRFLRSFTTRPVQSIPGAGEEIRRFDHVMRSVAFVYDNALALLAFLAEGTEDGLSRAQLIGEAFLYAAEHDRRFTDGRLRSAYSAGGLWLPNGWRPNNADGEVRLAGYYDAEVEEYHEMFASNISMGNTAWAMIALLALHDRTEDGRYLGAALKLGGYVLDVRSGTAGEGYTCPNEGFPGGQPTAESPNAPVYERFYSVEHNIDLYAAFSRLADLSGDANWAAEAASAGQFVASLWDNDIGCLRAGLDANCAVNRAAGQLPLDAQPWAVLGIPGILDEFPELLECAEAHHRVTCTIAESDLPDNLRGGGDLSLVGYDFNEDQDGLWFEGTAHMATAYLAAGLEDQARELREVLSLAEQVLPVDRGELPEAYHARIGLVAGCHDGITTGFGYLVMQRLHIGATAWNVFAQLGFNPYSQETFGEVVDPNDSGDDTPTTCCLAPGAPALIVLFLAAYGLGRSGRRNDADEPSR